MDEVATFSRFKSRNLILLCTKNKQFRSMSKKRKPGSSHKNRSGKQQHGGKLKQSLRQAVLAVMRDDPEQSFNYKQLAASFGISDGNTREVLIQVLHEMQTEELLESPERGKYKLAPNMGTLQGPIEITLRGAGFVRTEEGRDDIFIAPENLGQAMNGDTVEIKIISFRKGRSPEGEVVRVLQRARNQYVGIIKFKEKQAWFMPDNKKLNTAFLIPQSKINGALDGQKVVVKLIDWDEDNEPQGEVVDVLGTPGVHHVEMNAIMVEYGLDDKFPDAVNAEAADLELEPDEKEIKNRRDFRSVTTFTIDPEDAKDFDDALSIEYLENGLFRIGIHIADVSHYVRPGTKLDDEAYNRATSVYLVDRVIPMLPEVLSNKVCSLRPHETKFCFSAVFDLDETGKIYGEWFGRGVMLSDHRFSYEDAQQVIEAGEGSFYKELLLLNKIAKTLRAQRMENGALEIESSEIKFRLDDKGAPIEVLKKTSKDAHKLIEEFMLLANKRVCEYIGKPNGSDPGRVCVYRIHDSPAADKLITLKQHLETFELKVPNLNPQNASVVLNQVLKSVKDKPEEHIVRTLIIRSMAKAVYSTENIGHYGLHFEYYSHFTSPIRRYPDLMLHRILQDKIDQKPQADAGLLEKACVHSSNQEKMAAEAERESTKYKQAEFMEKLIGEGFEAVITSVMQWGFYVEITENFCEGFVPARSLPDDDFTFVQKEMAFIGRKTKKRYKTGDNIDVVVNRVDILTREVELMIPESY